MRNITRVVVSLDDNVPECMYGIYRVGSVVSYAEYVKEDGDDEDAEDDFESEIDHQDLVDNAEYHSVKDLIDGVASRLGVDSGIIEIVE